MQVIWTPPPLAESNPELPPGTVGPLIDTFLPSGPITVTSGQTVTGLWITRTSGTGPCISGNGVSNVHIYNCKIGPNSDTADTGTGISLTNATSIEIDHNSFDDIATSFYAVTSNGPLQFHHNYNTRIRGPGFGRGGSRGQMVQFNTCTAPGSKVTYNVSDLTNPGYGQGPEDHINMYGSSGSVDNPIIIKYNKCRGGGPSTSGGGILAGDNGGSHVHIISNNVINCGQYGIAVSGGNNNKLINNKVYSTSFPWTNVGMVVWRWNLSEPACFNNTRTGNRIWWINKDGNQNHYWEPNSTDAEYCTNTTASGNIDGDATLSPTTMWSEVFPEDENNVVLTTSLYVNPDTFYTPSVSTGSTYGIPYVPLYTWPSIPDGNAAATNQPVPTGITSGSTVNLVGGVNYQGTLNLSNLSNVTVNVTGTGFASITPASTASNAINASGTTNCRIIGGTNTLKLRQFNNGIDSSSSNGLQVSNVSFHNGTHGMHTINPVNMLVSQCYFSLIGKIGILCLTAATSSKITQCTFSHMDSVANSAPWGTAIIVEDGDNNEISGNYIKDCRYMGIKVMLVNNTHIAWNYVENTSTGPDKDSGAIYNQNVTGVGSVIITDNTVVNSGTAVSYYLDDLSNGAILDNNVASGTSKWALQLHRSFNCEISNNKFSGWSQKAIYLQSSTNNEMYNNNIHHNTFNDTLAPSTNKFFLGFFLASDVLLQATFDYNTYIGDSTRFGRVTNAAFQNTDRNYANWKIYYGDDANSTMNGV